MEDLTGVMLDADGRGRSAVPMETLLPRAVVVHDSRRLYEWSDIQEDAVLRDKFVRIYGMKLRTTRECRFPWGVRDALGDMVSPYRDPGKDKFPVKDAALAVATANVVLVDALESGIELLQNWANSVPRDDQRYMALLCKEMGEKLLREKKAWHERREELRTIPLLYTTSSSDPKEKQPSYPDSADDREPVVPPQSSSRPPEKSYEDELHEVKKELEKLAGFDRHVKKRTHDLTYMESSLRIFSVALVVTYLLSIGFDVVTQDIYSLVVMSGVIIVGIWGYLLVKFSPQYYGLVVFTMFMVVASFVAIVASLLRSIVYTPDFSGSLKFAPLAFDWIITGIMCSMVLFLVNILSIRNDASEWIAYLMIPKAKRGDTSGSSYFSMFRRSPTSEVSSKKKR